jgi:hypothetical protein
MTDIDYAEMGWVNATRNRRTAIDLLKGRVPAEKAKLVADPLGPLPVFPWDRTVNESAMGATPPLRLVRTPGGMLLPTLDGPLA